MRSKGYAIKVCNHNSSRRINRMASENRGSTHGGAITDERLAELKKYYKEVPQHNPKEILIECLDEIDRLQKGHDEYYEMHCKNHAMQGMGKTLQKYLAYAVTAHKKNYNIEWDALKRVVQNSETVFGEVVE